MWFIIILFFMQMTRGLCNNCCLQGSFRERLNTSLNCEPLLMTLTIVAIPVLMLLIVIIRKKVWPLISKFLKWRKKKALITNLKKTYSNELKAYETSSFGASKCNFFNQCIVVTNYEDLLTIEDDILKSKRVLFLGNSELSHYILQEWLNGNILQHDLLVYVKDNENSCILQVMKKMSNTDDTEFLSSALKEMYVTVIIDLDLNYTLGNQVETNRIEINELLRNNINQYPKMKVWAISRKTSGNYDFFNDDFTVKDGLPE